VFAGVAAAVILVTALVMMLMISRRSRKSGTPDGSFHVGRDGGLVIAAFGQVAGEIAFVEWSRVESMVPTVIVFGRQVPTVLL